MNLPCERCDLSPTSDLTDVITNDRGDSVEALLNKQQSRKQKELQDPISPTVCVEERFVDWFLYSKLKGMEVQNK
jgi:hypothetical protein